MRHHDYGIDCEHYCGGTPDDEDYCRICGAPMERVSCWHCLGEGGFQDCGEDCCCCLEPELNEGCQECGSRGTYLECTALPHTDEQVAAYGRRK